MCLLVIMCRWLRATVGWLRLLGSQPRVFHVHRVIENVRSSSCSCVDDCHGDNILIITVTLYVVLSKWICICDWVGRCDLPAVWYSCRPADWSVLARQHHLWHHVRGILKEWPSLVWWLRWFQLQRLGYAETGSRWSVWCSLTVEKLHWHVAFAVCLVCDRLVYIIKCLTLL